jgi:hypothetical protein
MWKSIIESVTKDSENALVTIKYQHTDGREKIVTERISNPNYLSTILMNGLSELNRVDSVAEFINNPPLGEFVFPVAEPDPDQAYRLKKQELISLKQDVELNLATPEAYDSLLNEVISLKNGIQLQSVDNNRP